MSFSDFVVFSDALNTQNVFVIGHKNIMYFHGPQGYQCWFVIVCQSKEEMKIKAIEFEVKRKTTHYSS